MSATFKRVQVALGVRDVDASSAFYAETLGFTVLSKMGEPSSFALLGRDTVTMALVQSEAPVVADFACAYIYVDDVAAMHAECAAARASIVNPLTKHPWGTEDFVIRDPDGHRIAIGQEWP